MRKFIFGSMAILLSCFAACSDEQITTEASGGPGLGGEIGRPVAEITIAGNLIDMYRELVPANDLEFRRATNVPTLRIDGMMVAGA